MFALSSSLIEVLECGSAVSAKDGVGNFGELSVNVEGESAELSNIDAAALAEFVVQIGHETTPNDQHLGLGLEGLLVLVSSLSGNVMLAWVIMGLRQNPFNDLLNAHA